MANLISNYGNLGLSDRAPRVTMWGEDNMALNQGGRMKTLIDEQQRYITGYIKKISFCMDNSQSIL